MPLSSFASLRAEIAAFVTAGSCAGCDVTGTLLCEQCAHDLRPRPQRRHTPAGLDVVAALDYEGVSARCVRRLKEEGETLLARPLGNAVAAAVRVALADMSPHSAGVSVVPIPTGRAAFRRRGYRVPDLLIRRAGLRAARVLAAARGTADQRDLGRAARERNVRGSMRAIRAGHGTPVLLLDDVITTGATLDEAARVLTAAGFEVVGAVAVAATARHGRFIDDTSAKSGDIR